MSHLESAEAEETHPSKVHCEHMNGTLPSQPSLKAPLQALDGLPIEEYVAQPRFHRKFSYHSTIAKKELVASYSIVGVQDPGAITYIYLGGVFGGRFHGLFVDYLCKKKGLKGIFPDRPGLGLFTEVTLEQRIPVLVEAIPLILKDAGVDRVCLMALSGGVPYLLNLLWHKPEIVEPDYPVYVLSPWVHPSKSEVRMHLLVSMVPSYISRGVGRVASFVLKSLISRVRKNKTADPLVPRPEAVPDACGVSAEDIAAQRKFFLDKLLAEKTSGAAEDYLLGIKDPKATWGVCADYEVFATRLGQRCEQDGTKFTLNAFFAAGDFILGEQGIQYFNDVFGGVHASGYTYHSKLVEGTDHENIAFPEMGTVGRLMDEVLEISKRKHEAAI